MRFRAVLVAALLSSCGAPRASAEPRSIGVQSGWSMPLGDLTDAVARGTFIGFSANQPIGPRHLLFLDFNDHVLRDRTTVPLPGYLTVRQSVRITETAVGFRAMLASPRAAVSPYLKFGVALEFVDPKVMLDTSSESIIIRDPHFWPGFLAAFGLSVPLGTSCGLRAEGTLREIESQPSAMNVGSVGLSFWARFLQR